jgi:hypothetical protein
MLKWCSLLRSVTFLWGKGQITLMFARNIFRLLDYRYELMDRFFLLAYYVVGTIVDFNSHKIEAITSLHFTLYNSTDSLVTELKEILFIGLHIITHKR